MQHSIFYVKGICTLYHAFYFDDTIPVLPAIVEHKRIYSPYDQQVVYVVNQQLPHLIERARQLRKREKVDFTRFYFFFVLTYFTICTFIALFYYAITLTLRS